LILLERFGCLNLLWLVACAAVEGFVVLYLVIALFSGSLPSFWKDDFPLLLLLDGSIPAAGVAVAFWYIGGITRPSTMQTLPLWISLSILATLLGFWGGAYWERNRSIPFNRVLWRAGTINQTIGGDVDPFRHKMVKDLLATFLHEGMTRDQVIALLGEPDSQNEEENEISYWLSQEYAWGIDPISIQHLVIRFNSNGYVEKLTHQTHRK